MATVTKTAGTVANLTYNPGGSPMGGDWADPSNAQGATDTTYAILAFASFSTPENKSLYASNFGFTTGDIPSGSTIDGIEFTIRRRNQQTGTRLIRDRYIYYVPASGATGTGTNFSASAIWASSDESKVFGGPTELAGLTWLDSDVRDSDFGIHFNFLLDNTGATMGSSANGYVDSVSCTIYFTAPPGGVSHTGDFLPFFF